MVEPPSPPYIPAKYQGGRQSVLKRIVLHGTVSKTYCGGAKAIAKYFQNPSAPSSAHYVTDPCSVYQCVYDHTIAWHDGTNTNSIGVEMCDPVAGPAGRWQDKAHQDMLRITANLVRQLCLAYGIPMVKLTPAQIRAGHKGICGHADMRDAFPGSTTHWDPGPDFPWAQFMQLVKKDSQPAGGGAAPAQPDLSEDDMPRIDLPTGKHAISFQIPKGARRLAVNCPHGDMTVTALFFSGDRYPAGEDKWGMPHFDFKGDATNGKDKTIDRLRPWRLDVPEGATNGAVYYDYPKPDERYEYVGSLDFI